MALRHTSEENVVTNRTYHCDNSGSVGRDAVSLASDSRRFVTSYCLLQGYNNPV